MKKKPEQKQPGSRFIIGLGGGHREYDIINARYIVEGRFADAMEDIISDEFTDLTAPKEEPKMNAKPVCSTAGKER